MFLKGCMLYVYMNNEWDFVVRKLNDLAQVNDHDYCGFLNFRVRC